MARWTDIATWVGPTVNEGDGDGRPGEAADRMSQHRGLVVHIAEGSYAGTIAWQKNPTAQVSSHFIVAKDGSIAQMVDTDDDSWCQIAGNDTWLSIENEGHTPGKLTDAQLAANARLLAKAHQVYGVPLQLATSPSGRGLGHHSMGAPAWGHPDCPGPNIIAQKPAIVAKAKAIVEGGVVAADPGFTQKERDWLYLVNQYIEALFEGREFAEFTLDGDPKKVANVVGSQLTAILEKLDQLLTGAGAGLPGLSADQLRAIVREEIRAAFGDAATPDV